MMVMSRYSSYLFYCFILSVIALPARADSSQHCVYLDRSGNLHQVTSLDRVPEDYRNNARCLKQVVVKPQEVLAKPQELDLGSTVRREELSTSMGRISLRWDRGVEQEFGRPPHRAVSDAMDTVNTFLRRAGVVPHKLIPPHLTEWNVVVMDQNLPSNQIPSYLVNNCHPGWMTPPANVYLVGQRVAVGCGNNTVRNPQFADVELARVVIHEIGHVVEYHLLNGSMGHDRGRAEGFAAWFEQAASEYSDLIPRGSTSGRYMAMARSALNQGYSFSQPFRGTGLDYAVQSLLFFAIAERKGLDEIISIYETYVQQSHTDFRTAAQQVTRWSDTQLEREMRAVVDKYAR
jgi:hypothetical protein